MFKVYDWTGKEIEFYGEHDSFEDAWGSVYDNFSDLEDADFDEQMEEFHVEEIEDND